MVSLNQSVWAENRALECVFVCLHGSARQRWPSDVIMREDWGMACGSGGERREASEEGRAGGRCGA